MKRTLLALFLGLGGCEQPRATAASSALLAAGTATVLDATRNAFSLPVPTLEPARRAAFFVGNSYFNQNWVASPSSVTSRDGLGPLFNARSCSGCHFKDGRGRPPEPGEPLRSMLLRVGLPQRDAHGAPRPDPTYGDQLQTEAVPGLAPEARVRVSYREEPGRFADGSVFSLRRPRYELTELGYGPPAAGLVLSPRVAPALIGLGLLEAVPDAAIEALADPHDRDRDGVSGRPNRIGTALGRFGWKAEQPGVRSQSEAAFRGDMGITADPGDDGQPELTRDVLDAVVLYVRALAVPARRAVSDARVAHGEVLFEAAGCASCHVPTLHTGGDAELPELRDLVLHAYTDLLLHDLGPGLGDGRPTHAAEGNEWRTPPLWGIGLVERVNGHALFLHDGRARGFAEAILWHGGEAQRARDAFVAMSATERADLVTFLESL